jgi:hypothetical protein
MINNQVRVFIRITMIEYKRHAVVDDVSYDIEELAKCYWDHLHKNVVPYGVKMKWDLNKQQAHARGMNAVDHMRDNGKLLTDYEPIAKIFNQFSLPLGYTARPNSGATPEGFHKINDELKQNISSLEEKPGRANEEHILRPYHPNNMDLIVYNRDYLFVPHVDYYQNFVMMVPIWPLEPGPAGYTPVKYHHYENQIEYIQERDPDWRPGDRLPKHIKLRHMDPYEDVDYYIDYSNEHPTMLNGRYIHSIGPVKEELRVMLRFKFMPPTTYEDAIELHKQGKWVKGSSRYEYREVPDEWKAENYDPR